MIIHKTHSKAELVNIIVNYDIDINNPVKYRKIELSAILVKSLQLIDKIIPVPNMPFLTLIIIVIIHIVSIIVFFQVKRNY